MFVLIVVVAIGALATVGLRVGDIRLPWLVPLSLSFIKGLAFAVTWASAGFALYLGWKIASALF